MVEVSTVTGDAISYDQLTQIAVVEGHAVATNSTATIQADKMTIDMVQQQGHASGHVWLEQSSGTLRGDEIFYNWHTSTGMVINALGVNDPWHFSADRLLLLAPGVFNLENGDVTSCDVHPPHYLIRSRSGHWVSHKRMTLKNPFFHVGDAPVLWSPIYSKSLKPKKYRLRIEPGASGRDGLILRNTLIYPFTENTETRFRWDYFQNTGNGFGLEHSYYLPHLKGDVDAYYVYDKNPDPTPEQRKYSLLWNHYHKMTSQLTANAKVNFVNNQSFVNDFGQTSAVQRRINAESGLLTEAGLTYQFSKASARLDVLRKDRYDPETGESFVSQYALPNISFDTIPLISKRLPFYTSFRGNFFNQTQVATTASESLRLQRSVLAGMDVNKDIRIRRNTTLIPRFGLSGSWQSHDFTEQNVESDVYQARSNMGLDVKRRLRRNTDINLSYLYAVRSEPNRTNLDEQANDHGVESNRLNGSMFTRIGRNNQVVLSSGYDFRSAPKNDPHKYEHTGERITPPALDIQWELKQGLALFFRETYGIYDSNQNKYRYTPLNTAGELQVGNPNSRAYFSQGFSYTKTPEGLDPILNLTNRIKFYLSPKWYVDFSLAYLALADQKMQYHKVQPNEKRLLVVRDMHCWLFRMEFLKNSSRNEASFYIDLKSNLGRGKNVFEQKTESFYHDPTRVQDLSTVFPSKN